MPANIRVKRVYELPDPSDGKRYLVDRLWPRAISHEAAAIDHWHKELAPSHELRRWFAHDPTRWEEFKRRYADELRASPEAWAPLLAEARSGRLTLLYSARDEENNQAVALAGFLRARVRRVKRK